MRALLLTAMVVLVPASPAAADPAGPTDVRTAILSVEPALPTVHIELLGGGAFVRLHVDRGTTTTVIGYEAEPYVRIGADGTVAENVRSPAVYLNRTRLGSSPVPESADAKAEPEWRRVGTGGTFVWHDHRTHWMAAGVPPRPVEWTVPLIVDGQRVTVSGRYEPVPVPSALPWLGLLVASFLVTVLVGWRHPRLTAAAVLLAGVAALPVALALARLPAAGVNSWIGVGICVFGVVGPVLALTVRRRQGGGLLTAAAGLGLALFAGLRTDVLGHAVLVTTLPGWLDRLSVALGLGVGLAAVVVGHAAAMRTPTLRSTDEADPLPVAG